MQISNVFQFFVDLICNKLYIKIEIICLYTYDLQLKKRLKQTLIKVQEWSHDRKKNSQNNLRQSYNYFFHYLSFFLIFKSFFNLNSSSFFFG